MIHYLARRAARKREERARWEKAMTHVCAQELLSTAYRARVEHEAVWGTPRPGDPPKKPRRRPQQRPGEVVIQLPVRRAD